MFDDTQLTDVIASGEYDLFSWGWTPFVDPDPMLSYFTCDQVTTDVESVGYNDANWCDEQYDALYEQQKVELDRDERIEIVHEMLRLFYDESTYVVLFEDADLRPTAPTASRAGCSSRPRSGRCCSPTRRRRTST